MKAVIIAAMLMAGCALTTEAKPQLHEIQGYSFEKFTAEHNRVYTQNEYSTRRRIFEENKAQVLAHNAQKRSWTMTLNHMADWTAEERRALNGGRSTTMANAKKQLTSIKSRTLPKVDANANPLPFSMDWRNRVPQVISAVKNQGMCGDCWAQAATESMESMEAIVNGNLFTLSNQQITSCTQNPNQCGGTGGCMGATAELAYDYAHAAGGVAEERTYPFTSYYGDTGNCTDSTKRPLPVQIDHFVKLPENDQDTVMATVAGTGPLAVNVDATNWHFYNSGIFDGCAYNASITINHVVQLVGYGTDLTFGKYWLVRNSWSATFGEHGYIRLKRDDVAQCGTDNSPADGVACAPFPATQHVCGQCGILFDTSFPVPTKKN